MVNSIVEAIKNYSVSQPDKRCVVDAKIEYTYAEYYKKIKNVAAFLNENGVKKGDKVIIKTAQNLLFLATFHAIHLIGAVAVPLEKTVKAERVYEINEVVEAVCYICDKPIEEINCLLYNDIDACENEYEPDSLPMSSDDSTILFTTGTTGKSKGILMCHAADVAVAENVVGGTEMTKENVEVIPQPLNHSFSIRRYYANMINGSTVIIMDGVIFVNRFFDAFDKNGATSAAMAPSALAVIFKLSADKLAEYDGKIEYLQFGGSYMPESDKDKIRELLPSARLYNFYGSTEAGCSSIIDFNKEKENPYNIGKATVNSDIRFVDENNNFVETDANNPARLVTGGKMLMNEYYKEPELTAQTLIDGYIYSNDMGYIDEKGNIIMLGRMDDVIICGGQKISPLDVENVCNKYEGVVECAVIGIDDAIMGQVAKLFVVVNEKYDEMSMMQFLGERLENFQVPKIVQIIKEIPKTFNGKPLKRELKNM
ncbi:MAG: acyl--CoA ligase [Clostridia bacterium]|nr:acyl--CoA ligase [Clostridia bacterium]